MARYYYEHRRGGRMRSLRWISIALVVTAIILFFLVIFTFVMQIQAFVEEEIEDLRIEYPDAHTLIGAVDICLQTTLGAMLVVTCFGAGSTGIAMSDSDDATHNISLKNSLLGHLMTTFVAALLYIVMVGTVYFLIIDKYVKDLGELRRVAEWYYTSHIFVITCLALAFIIAILSIVGYFMAYTYRPFIPEQVNSNGNRRDSSNRNRAYERHLDRGQDYYSDYVTEKIYPSRGHIVPYRHNITRTAARPYGY